MRDDVDLHIHTARIGCANETMTVPALLERCEHEGITTIAITDHLNTPDQLPTHLQIKEDLRACEGPVKITWGVEVNVIDKDTGAVSINEQQIEEAGFEFVIGGPHGTYFSEPDAKGIIDLQHRLMMAVVQNPLIDVLVHPWWFGRGEFENGTLAWLTDLQQVPEEHIDELAEAAVTTGTAIEMNGSAIITNASYGPEFQEDYKRYFRDLYERGVSFTVASDAHDINTIVQAKLAAQYLDEIGVPDERIVVPPPSDFS